MAKLVQCKVCGKDVSSGADKCPHCGQSMRRWWQARVETDNCFIFGCLAIVAALLIFFFCFGGVGIVGL